ncbi:hypothetical protein CKY02_21870 [Photorhabdus bodei]|uniref:Uncharacterized protein n=2 Tax=Photorhabdus TaxID=29487 RepID=A0A329WS26_9GAMM|nr:hypothetical protein Phpb_01295 [Photorhabdus namnaonensis]RAX06956.1 hypothetical protein CKY02_21870 [Photorhabdus bodei]
MKIKNHKNTLLYRAKEISKLSKKTFKKEALFFNFFIVYIVSVFILRLDTPILEYIDYSMSIILLIIMFSTANKISNEFSLLKKGFKKEYSHDKKPNFFYKIFTLSIITILLILVSIPFLYILNHIHYDFSLKLFLNTIMSSYIYLIVIIFSKPE